MIEEGVVAPTFELPALVDGAHRRVAVDDYIGEDVVILAFYPGDFNPACDEESDLDELDLFTMQKDVTVLGIGPDTLYAHEAFADAYDLDIPLLSDTRREVAELYDVTFEDDAGQDLVERAVFVIDHDGEIAYAWSTRDVAELPRTEAIKDAIGETGGDETAFARYRVGHAHYVEGRRAFTSAMGSYADSEWMIAQSDFQRAREEFTEADEHFDSAVRFVDDELFAEHYEAAEEKATHLWQAADWLAESASHYSSGRGAEGQRLRDDAEGPLEEARALPDPIDPDEWPPADPPEREEPADAGTFVPTDDEDDGEAALSVDIDEESAEAEETAAAAADAAAAGEDMSPDDERTDIDDDELAEIEAELADAPSDDPVDEAPEERRSVIDHEPADEDGDAADPGDADAAAEESSSAEEDGTVDDGEELTDDDLAELGAEIAAGDPGEAVDEATDGGEAEAVDGGEGDAAAADEGAVDGSEDDAAPADEGAADGDAA